MKKKTVWIIDFDDKWIIEIEYSESPYHPYSDYEKYDTKEECKKLMIDYYESNLDKAKSDLEEVKKMFK